jgi:hypothetical protein
MSSSDDGIGDLVARRALKQLGRFRKAAAFHQRQRGDGSEGPRTGTVHPNRPDAPTPMTHMQVPHDLARVSDNGDNGCDPGPIR